MAPAHIVVLDDLRLLFAVEIPQTLALPARQLQSLGAAVIVTRLVLRQQRLRKIAAPGALILINMHQLVHQDRDVRAFMNARRGQVDRVESGKGAVAVAPEDQAQDPALGHPDILKAQRKTAP